MDAAVQDPKMQSEQGQESLCSHSSQGKKNLGKAHKRILKDHDLDKLLIYTKRGAKKSQDFYQQWNKKELEQLSKKKERKKEKIAQKKQTYIKKQAKQQSNKQKINLTITDISQNISTKNKQALSEKQKDVISKPTRPKKLEPIHRTVYKIQYDKYQEQELKFPITNQYLTGSSQQYMETFAKHDLAKETLGRSPHSSTTFVNCDVKYFNWHGFTEKLGKFDVLIIDPPWRIKGAQKNDSQFMFSNCRFSLQYNTMSNHEIKTLPLNVISDQGFIFLWILNTQLNSSLQIMQSWGYQLVQEIIWVKLRNQKIYLTHGYYFMHSYEICLVGYKNIKNNKITQNGQNKIDGMNVRHGLNFNVIFGEVRKKSQKPEDMYNIIEMMFKGKRKIQIFARNHNLKFGIFSIGNQLGQAFDKWTLHLRCDECKRQISNQNKRFKSKVKANYDLCQSCVATRNKDFFFQLSNQVDEDVRHQYLTCNDCGIQPIWGNRFQCITCCDYDLCENCFDKYLANKNEEKLQKQTNACQHEFRVLEVPVFGNGFNIHEYKCNSCYQNPIIGICFSCTSCRSFKLQGQKCFFERPREDKGQFSKTHRQEHQFQILFEPIYNIQKKFECFNCRKTIEQQGGGAWMCENCYNFFFCQECYNERDKFKSLYANTHKKYHVFTKIF